MKGKGKSVRTGHVRESEHWTGIRELVTGVEGVDGGRRWFWKRGRRGVREGGCGVGLEGVGGG